MNQSTSIENGKPSGISLRTLVIGLIVVFVNAYWVSVNEFIIGPIHNYVSLFSNAVFTLFVLALLNLLLEKLLPKLALRPADLLVIYAMVVMVTTVAGYPMNRLVGTLAHPFWFATAENDWRHLFWRHIPAWFTIRDQNALSNFYRGESSFFIPQYMTMWLRPMLYWSAFMFVIYFVLICISTIVRKQFTEHERLTYPITWLPLELGRAPLSFLKNKLMWTGFGIAGGISLLNGLHTLYPSVPDVPVGWQNIIPQEKPWSYIGWTPISFQPFVIGLSYFMPLDLAFSALFFFFFKQMTRMLLGVIGWRTLYFHEQAQGAWVGLGIFALWVGRKHFKRVFMQAITGKGGLDESKEPLRYRTALLGIIAGLLFFLWFASKAGFSFWVMPLFLVLYWCGAVGVTKVRASLGVAVHNVLWVDPGRIMVSSVGTRVFGPQNLTALTFLFWLNREHNAHPMPNQLEAFRIGEQANINNRKLAGAMIITFAISIPATFLLYLILSYHHGAGNSISHFVGVGRDCFTRRLQPWLNFPTGPNYGTVSAMGMGFGIIGFLWVMKMRFLWWPFHPIGYVLGVSPAEMAYHWCPVFISWSVKLTILRYGGLQAYRRALPFFAGLILGDYTMGGIWSIISPVFNVVTYTMAWHR